MKRFYAERLLKVCRIQEVLSQLCLHGFAGTRMTPVIRNTELVQDLEEFEEHCRELGLPVSAAETRRFLAGLQRDKLDTGDLHGLAHCVVKVLESELATSHFLSVRPGYSERMLPLPHFGEAVARVFPDASRDIGEASACLALERYPACVFHSMMVLEYGLRWMYKRLKMRFPPYDSWGPLISDLEAEIAKLNPPKAKTEQRRRRDFLAGAASHLHVVKDGWRNHVAHGRANYGPEASEVIYESVRRFMMELAEYTERGRRKRP
jgi:hypothetical protein